jgi:hypothetical protein
MQKRLLATTVLALSMFAMARAQAGGGGGANHDQSSRSAAIPLGQLAPPEKRDRHRKRPGGQSPFQLAFVIHAGQNDSGINGRLARRVSQ